MGIWIVQMAVMKKRVVSILLYFIFELNI
jgi:hypothetical protein